MSKPYKDKLVHKDSRFKVFERLFSFSSDSMEMVWHRDRKTRIVEVMEGDGWALQFDNQLPMPLQTGVSYMIPAKVYHRVHMGDGDLKLMIFEFID